MIRKPLVEAVANKPADREIDLCLSHETPVMDDPEKRACQHETDGCFRRDTGTAGPDAAEIGNVLGQPAEIKHPVDAGKDMAAKVSPFWACCKTRPSNGFCNTFDAAASTIVFEHGARTDMEPSENGRA